MEIMHITTHITAFGDQKENRVASGGEGEGSGLGCEPCHEVPEPGTVQGSTTTISPPAFIACFAHASVTANASIHPFGATAATAPTHAHAATFGICVFVAEPTHPPSNALQPATTATTTKARST
jgi:hypothetical protein